MDCVETLELDAPEALPRETLGGFSLVHRMATGGMATVYLGHRRGPTGATQVAALKVMLPRFVDDAEYVEMFFDEARLTSSINHPYVCKVLEYGVEDRFHYLATEYVLGETWADLIEVLHETPEGKTVAPMLLSHIAAQACEGLHAVHETYDERGKYLAIVHRDVSPQNVMVCYDGTVRILDFGIASAAERLHETRNGVLKGHVAYMAPEQMEIQAVDRRCDIWPLGVLLWEGVTGRRLFRRANSRATMKAVTCDPIGPLLKSGPHVDRALMSVIERAVVRDPNARFATAREMGAELSSLSLGATTMTNAQVASWMRHLFAERFERKRAQLRAAVGQGGGDLLVEASQSAVRLAVGPQSVNSPQPKDFDDVLPPRDDLAVVSPTYDTYLPPPVGRGAALSPRVRWALGSLALVVVIGGGIQLSQSSGKPTLQSPAAVTSPALSAKTDPALVGILDVRASGRPMRVELEGRDLGLTPLRMVLSPGDHQLRIVPDIGADPTDTHVVIESGERYLMEIERDNSAKVR